MAQERDPAEDVGSIRPFGRTLAAAWVLCGVGVGLLTVAVWATYARGDVERAEHVALWVVVVATVAFECAVLWGTTSAARIEDHLLRARQSNDPASYLRGSADALGSARLWLGITKRPTMLEVWARLLLAWAPEGLSSDERLVLEALKAAVARTGDDRSEARGVRDALEEVETALREAAALRDATRGVE